jgi:Protein of unknown function (DUF1822)
LRFGIWNWIEFEIISGGITVTYSNNLNLAELDFEVLPVEAIALDSSQIHRAIEISDSIPSPLRQWQVYLNALALFGFEQWLGERDGNLAIFSEECTILQPKYANTIDAVCNLRVGDFKVCLIATGSLMDEEITLPKAAIDLPEFAAQFYVVMEIQEELEQAIVRGFLRRDSLIQVRALANLQADEEWNYQIPIRWFETDADSLLLYLRCLEPAGIYLPEIESDRLVTLSNIQAELSAVLSQLQSPNTVLSQVLTWEQATAVLTNPELVEWIYRLQSGELEIQPESARNCLSDLLSLLTQQTVNVACWLQDQIDDLAQGLSWVLMPAFIPATEMMRGANSVATNPAAKFETIIGQLINTGIDIPPMARGAYQELNLLGNQVRLYALTWPLLSPENTPEWTLMLVLGSASEDILPAGIRLRVSDRSGILVERQLNSNNFETYLYLVIVGGWDEKFLATISLSNGVSLTLPPFGFNP